MKLRIAKKIFATPVGVPVNLPNGKRTWIGESLRHRHFLLMKALQRLSKVKVMTYLTHRTFLLLFR